jgi:hypothetical protein
VQTSVSRAPAEDDDGGKVSSAVIFDQMGLLRERYGPRVLVEASSSLRSDWREELSQLSPGSWISLGAARELKNTVADRVGVAPLELQRMLSSQGVERTLTTFWRFLLQRLGDEALSHRTPIIYSRTFNRGRLLVASWREGGVEFALSGWRIPSYDLIGLVAGIKRVLELAHRNDVHVTTIRKEEALRLHATWQGRVR